MKLPVTNVSPNIALNSSNLLPSTTLLITCLKYKCKFFKNKQNIFFFFLSFSKFTKKENSFIKCKESLVISLKVWLSQEVPCQEIVKH